MNIKEIRDMSSAELEKHLRDEKESLFNLRFQHTINQLDNPNKISETKHTIARLMTVLREREVREREAREREISDAAKAKA